LWKRAATIYLFLSKEQQLQKDISMENALLQKEFMKDSIKSYLDKVKFDEEKINFLSKIPITIKLKDMVSALND